MNDRNPASMNRLQIAHIDEGRKERKKEMFPQTTQRICSLKPKKRQVSQGGKEITPSNAHTRARNTSWPS